MASHPISIGQPLKRWVGLTLTQNVPILLLTRGSEAFGLVFDFASAPFVYSSGDGNLLMDILISDQSLTPFQYPAWTAFSYSMGMPDIYSRAWNNVEFGESSDSGGLRTKFEYKVVPIPCTMLLLGSGLIGLVGLGRKFRKR
jgi:hypothetical protein